MTTTAHEDQYTVAPEPVRQPYDTVAILRRNVADLELALRTQTERAEKAEAELAQARQQKPVAYVKYKATGGNVGLSWLAVPTGEFYPREGEPLYVNPVPAPAVPAEWHDDVFAAAEELRSTVRDLKNGFVRCGNCGEQETTSDLDCVSDIDGALELLDGLLQSAPATVAVTAEWREVISDLLANDGADGGRYDASKWLAARDKARALLQSAEGSNAATDRLLEGGE